MSRNMKTWGSGHSHPQRALGISSILSGTPLLPALGRGRGRERGVTVVPLPGLQMLLKQAQVFGTLDIPLHIAQGICLYREISGQPLRSSNPALLRSEAGAHLRMLGGALPAPGQLQTPWCLIYAAVTGL